MLKEFEQYCPECGELMCECTCADAETIDGLMVDSDGVQELCFE